MTATSTSLWTRLLDDLTQILEPRRVISKAADLKVYECDGLTSYRQMPKLVVLPKTTAEVAGVVKCCADYGVGFVARGSGTGLSGGSLPGANTVVIATTLMKQILRVDIPNQTVTVQPGVINAWVTQAVQGAGYFYAPDPSSQSVCSIGGNVAENSGGVHCLKYGVTSNHVLGLKVVLPTGEVVDLGGQIPEMPGLDLVGVFVGSEGTLGIATEITLRLVKAPEQIQVLLADFAQIEQAGEAVSQIIGAGIIPAGMEIMDNFSINAVEDVVATQCYPRDAGAVLLVELDGTAAEVAATSQQVMTILQQQGSRQILRATDPQERLRIWKGRKAAFAAMGKLSPNYYVQDGVIPRSQLSYVLGEIQKLSQAYGYPVANVFHAGDGNLHPLILYDLRQPGSLEQVEALGGEILKLCVRVGGSISGEHGIGADKRCYMTTMFSPTDIETMLWVRQAFDPKGIANPDKIFPTPRTCGESARAYPDLHLNRTDLELF
ncbi:MAG: FAD-linked oxidase C-terminal domain-containing protein [Thermostichales cyanobacterium BF4_bins_65]